MVPDSLPSYWLVGIVWASIVFLVLLMMVPAPNRKRAVTVILALTAIFAVVTAVLFILSPDAPRPDDWLNKLIDKKLGG